MKSRMRKIQDIGVLEREILGQKGHLVLPQVFEKNRLEPLREYLNGRLEKLWDRFLEWSGQGLEKNHSDYLVHSQNMKAYEARGIPKDLRHFLRGEFDVETRLSQMVRRFLSSSEFKKVAAQIWGSEDIFFHYPPMLRFKIPQASEACVPPHQDSAYNQSLGPFLTLWLPLTTIDSEVGGVLFYEGSHHLGPLDHGPSGSWESKAHFNESLYPVFSPAMECGDLLVFIPDIVHASAPNLSSGNVVRLSIDVRVFGRAQKSKKAYYDPFSEIVHQPDPSEALSEPRDE